VNDDKKMGDLLNSYFASAFTNEDTDHLPPVKQVFPGVESECLSSFTITSDMVKAKLNRLKMNKAPGIDSVGTRMLLELVDEISEFLADLYNISLHTRDVPHDWKLANVTAVFKKGKKCSPSDYRPICLTVHVCKVFESIVRDWMIEHLEKYALIKESQHGFVKDKSCLTSLLIFMEEVTSYIDSGFPVDVIYLDFQKAFAKVPHCRLISKLKAHGITGNILR